MADSPVKKAKHEGIKQYERFILGVCNVEHFSLLTNEEKNGYYGIAMLLAFQAGAKPNLKEFAYRLRVTPYLLEDAFNALRANGIFTDAYKKAAVNPKGLEIGRDVLSNQWITTKKRDLVDWCWVAGMASSYCGLK